MAGTDKNINIVIPTQSANFRAAEAYKTLRSNIQFCGADNKVILLTSSIPNEGKTTVSIMLAAAFAEMGKKVLLIDADLRKSVLMKKLQINVKRLRGLSHYLSGQQELSDVIYVTNVPNLHLVLDRSGSAESGRASGQRADGKDAGSAEKGIRLYSDRYAAAGFGD